MFLIPASFAILTTRFSSATSIRKPRIMPLGIDLKVFRRLKFLQMPQYTFEQPKEIFYREASLSGSRASM